MHELLATVNRPSDLDYLTQCMGITLVKFSEKSVRCPIVIVVDLHVCGKKYFSSLPVVAHMFQFRA